MLIFYSKLGILCSLQSDDSQRNLKIFLAKKKKFKLQMVELGILV